MRLLKMYVGCVSYSVKHQTFDNDALWISSSRTLQYLILFKNQVVIRGYFNKKIGLLITETEYTQK